MIQIELLEKLLMAELEEIPCKDNSCPDCKEIQQLFDSAIFRKLLKGIVQELKPASYYEDILHTFYLGFKMGRKIEKLNV